MRRTYVSMRTVKMTRKIKSSKENLAAIRTWIYHALRTVRYVYHCHGVFRVSINNVVDLVEQGVLAPLPECLTTAERARALRLLFSKQACYKRIPAKRMWEYIPEKDEDPFEYGVEW